MLKPYNYEIQAVRITKKNYAALEELSYGDGCLSLDSKEENLGQWLVNINGGYEVWPGYIKLVPIRKN